MTKKEKLIDLLHKMSDFEIVHIHNEYCQNVNYFDDEIFTLDMWDDIFHGSDTFDIACKVYYGDFKPTCEYFKFNGYGNIQSICKYEIDRYVDINEIVDYAIENNIDFDNRDILCILDNNEYDL